MGTDSEPTKFRTDLTDNASSLLVTAFGLATSLLVVGIDWVFKHSLDLNFPSIMHWFIIPTGALCTGAAAASGYYFGAKRLHQMPNWGSCV